MKKIVLTFVFACFGIMPLMAGSTDTAQSDTKKLMLGELDIIKHEFAVKYAPADWKKQYAGWDLETAIQEAKQKVLSSDDITLKQFQRIVKEFFLSTQDYHVSVQFYSTALAYLPFRVESADGRFFVVSVDNFFAILLGLPLEIGDEIISFDGQSIASIVEEIKAKELGNPSAATDQTFAEAFLTMRFGLLGHTLPKNDVAIQVRHKDGSLQLYETSWISAPEKINPPANMKSLSLATQTKQKRSHTLSENPLFFKEMTAANAKIFEQARKNVAISHNVLQDLQNDTGDAYHDLLADKRGVLPALGEVVWNAPADSTFHAYIFKNGEGKNIGFIRLPTFVPDFFDVDKSAEDFKSIIATFESQTDALIIDETGNPGGFVMYMYALISMLADKPLHVTSERQTLTQQDVYYAQSDLFDLENLVVTEEDAKEVLGETLLGYSVSLKFIQQMVTYFRFIVDEWNSGRTFTNPTYFFGIDVIEPNAVHYTKPLLLLVNQMDISCGDFFPAILQDNQRATIFGMKTAGAGGFVLEGSYPNLFGIAGYTYTGSIAQRLDGRLIENLGVTPDIRYTLSAVDYQHNYINYKEAILKALQQLIGDSDKTR